MARIADPLRERILRMVELGLDEPMLVQTLDACANNIDQEHARRIEQCKKGVRRDFANYLRSVIADYEKGISRRNRNHAHCKVTTIGDGVGHAICTGCNQRISTTDNYCRHCGAKLTATEYEDET